MMFNFDVWLRSRTTPSIMCYQVEVEGTDWLETAHDIMVQTSDEGWECYDVRFMGIECFEI